MILIRLLIQTVGLAIAQIWTNKFRAMLTTLGIIIAVCSIVAVTAVGEGFKTFILDQFATFGANKVWIFPNRPDNQRERYSWRQIRITDKQVDGLLENVPSMLRISPVMNFNASVQVGDEMRDFVTITGIWPEWHEIEQRFVTVGRTFNSTDERDALQVCLINDKGVQELQLPTDPTGITMLLEGRRFKIVGVIETRSVNPMFGGDRDTQVEVFVPYATGKLMRPEPRMYIVGQTKAPDLYEDVKEETTFYMRRMRNLEPDEPNTFGVEAIDQVISQFNKIAKGITLFLAGVVGISLLVGGIGIMNIMLVSVSERTHEIGLRKAMGAQPKVILMQFLVEAVTLCLVGCAIGLAIGGGMVLLFQMIPESPVTKASIPTWAMVLSVGFSAATGIIFGMGPAIKASRLDPIVALRHE
ncbi:MAG: ABC transporter permease [Phycisphaerales bacterium]